MLTNFTIVDVVGTVEAAILMTLVLFVPGYVIGWVFNLLRFRHRRLITQIVLSTPLAVSVLPIVVYRAGPYPALLWGFFGLCWLAFALLFRRKAFNHATQGFPRLSRKAWFAAALGGLWAIAAITSLVDWQFCGRLYFSVPAFDYSLRTALTAAAAKHIPAWNPFFASVPPVLCRYHYFWMMLCGLVTRLAGVGPRQAMYGGTIWAGFVLVSLIAILHKFFLHVREQLERKILIAVLLLTVTGLDILPTLYLYAHYHVAAPNMDAWNEIIPSWLASLLISPHHLMGLTAGMVGLVLLRQPASTLKERLVLIAFAGLSFASAFGLSVLTTFACAVFIALWLPYAALRRWWGEVTGILAAGGIAACLAFPFIATVVGSSAVSSGGEGRFFQVSTRGFWIGIDFIAWLAKVPPDHLSSLTLPLLPVNYFFELGFFFAIGILRLAMIRRGSVAMTREEETGWMMVVTSLFMGSFLRSNTLGSNDLGFQCFQQTQLVLLLWAALMVDDWWQHRQLFFKRHKILVIAMFSLASLGLIGTAYQFGMLRVFPILYDRGSVRPMNRELASWLDQDHRVGERTYFLRSAYDKLATMMPKDSIVQYNPMTPTYLPHQLYSLHDAAMGLPNCGVVLGGDSEHCRGRSETIPQLFENPSPEQNLHLDDVCRQYRISALVVDDNDPVWQRSDSWVWTRTPLLFSDRVRVLGCGGAASRLISKK